MPTLDDVREIALALPDVFERVEGHSGGASWRLPTGSGAFVWERGPRKTDVAQLAELGRQWPDGAVIAVRTDGLEMKDALLGSDPDVFFTIPHFDGFPAVLVRLDAIERAQLEEIVADAWLVKAPKRVAKAWLDERGLAGQE